MKPAIGRPGGHFEQKSKLAKHVLSSEIARPLLEFFGVEDARAVMRSEAIKPSLKPIPLGDMKGLN
jgi:hypothetical protein